MSEITIRVYEASDGGYMYDVYKGDAVDEDAESDDGGQCTGNMQDALEMAVQSALSMPND